MQKNIWIAAKYLRLSIEDGDKAESESIVNQSILIDNYMKSTSDITIVETFKDDGFSGTDFKRPGFQAMLKAIENKEINCIIVKDLSRFGREHIDVDRYIQKVFPQLGVRFIAINDNYDSETANITDTHLVLPVKSFVNDTYCRQNSQKVRSHLSAKRNIGEYVGNYVSYGYKKCDADKSQIEIDPVAAKHVRDIFNWKMEGMSNQLIADKLNELGVLAPADYKRATGVNFKSSFQTHLTSRWSAVAIIRILKNPIYYGVLQQGKSQRINYKVKVQRALPKEEWVIFENHHEGIVTKEEYELTNEGVILTEKVATELDVKSGDMITIQEDTGDVKVKVVSVCENYIGNYMYMTTGLYEELYGKEPEENSIMFKMKKYDEEGLMGIGEKLIEQDAVLNVTYTNNMEERIADMLGSLNLVIVVLIISAGMLAFVVLYNLNNINITERKRELATLKVLGFYDKEVASYVFRENILLTIIGSLVGMGIGKILHQFVIVTVEVEGIMFGRNIDFPSFLYSFLFTVGFSLFVNWVMYFKLKRIDMVESLKSVE